MISKRKKLSGIILVIFLISMVLSGFVQPAQADDSLNVVSITPADNAIDVPLTTNITATYSEPIFQGPHFAFISLVSNQVYTGISAAINDDSKLVITPTSALLPNTTYTVTIPTAAVQDGAGNFPQEAEVFSFTTINVGSAGGGGGSIPLTYGHLTSDPVSLNLDYSSPQTIKLTSDVENVFKNAPTQADLWKVDSNGAIVGTAPVWSVQFITDTANILSFTLPVLSGLEAGHYAWVIGAYPPAAVYAAHFEITATAISGGSTEAWLDIDNSALKTALNGSSSINLKIKNITFDRAELSIDYDPAMSAVTANAWCPGVSDDPLGPIDTALDNGWHRSTFTIIDKDAYSQAVKPLTIGESGDTVYKVNFTNLNHEGTVPVSLGIGSSSSCYVKLNVYYNGSTVPVTVPVDTNIIPGTTFLSFTDKAHIAYAVDFATREPIGNGSIQYKISATDSWQKIDTDNLSVDSVFGGYFFNSPTEATEDTAYQFLAEGYQTTSIDKYPDKNWDQSLYHYTFTANKNGIYLPYQGTDPFTIVFAYEPTFTIPMIDVQVPSAMGADAIPTLMLYDQQNNLVAQSGICAKHNVMTTQTGDYWHMFGGVNMTCISSTGLTPGVYQLKAVLDNQQSNAIPIKAVDGPIFCSGVEPYLITAGSQSASFVIRGYKVKKNLSGLSVGLSLDTNPITLSTVPVLTMLSDDPNYTDQDRLQISYSIPSPGLSAGNYQIELSYNNKPVSFINSGGSLNFQATAAPFINKISPANPQAGSEVKVYGENLSGKTFNIYMYAVGSSPGDPVATGLTPISVDGGGQYLEFTIPAGTAAGTYTLYAVDTATSLSIIGNLGFNISGVAGTGISGTVTAAAGGTALSGITVMAMDSTDYSIRYYGQSDSNGAYSITVPAGKQYIVVAYPGKDKLPYTNTFYSSTGANTIDAATPVSPGATINFALVPGGSISGTVTDENNQPITGVTVTCQQTASGAWHDWEETDSSGRYTLAGLPYGTYTVVSPPSDNTDEFKNIKWMQSEIEGIEINDNNVNVTGQNLTLAAVDHPIITDIWPKWISTDTTEGWINLQGAGFNTLGAGKTLQLKVNDQVIASSSEMNISSDGSWLSAKFVRDSNIDIGSSSVNDGSISVTDSAGTASVFKCTNQIGITSEPLVNGDVSPWAISSDQTSANLRLSGANLTSLGTEPFIVSLVNKDNLQQSYTGTAQVNIIPKDGEYLDVSFNNLDLATGSYYITATPTVHGMVKTDTVTDLSIWVTVTDKPAVTGVTLQPTSSGSSTILVEGVNFSKLTAADLSAVFTSQGDTSIGPFVQPIVTIQNDTQIQVSVPGDVPTGEKYDFDLVKGTTNEEWISHTQSFYLPVVNGQAQFGFDADLVQNEVQTGDTWASEAFQVPVSSENYYNPVKQLQAQIRGASLAAPIDLPLSMSATNGQLVLNVPAGLLRVGYYELVLKNKQTGNELDKRTLFIDNQTIPVIYDEHPEVFKTGIASFKVQCDGSTAIKDLTSCTVKLMDQSGLTEIATANKVNWDKEKGRYLEAMFINTENIGTGEYTLLIKDGSGNPIKCLNGSNEIQFTNQPFVYNEVEPWTINGSDKFLLKIYGQNLTGLNGLSTLSLYDNNKNVVSTSASVSVAASEGKDVITATFNPSNTPLPEGWYTLKSNLASEIGNLQSINLNVSYQPRVTGANIEYSDTLGSNQLVISGINLRKILTESTTSVIARIYRDGAELVDASVNTSTDNMVDNMITVPLSMDQLKNKMNGYYQVWLIANQSDGSQIWLDRNADFEISTDPIWVQTDPNYCVPAYTDKLITVNQGFQQAWKANETLKIQITPFRAGQQITGYDNLSPTTGSVTNSNLTFTLPAGLPQGIYQVEIYSGTKEVAQSRIQIGGPWITTSGLSVGYSAANMTVQQVDSAFWQTGDNLTIYIKQNTDNGLITPSGFEVAIQATAVTATSFSFTLNTGLPVGNYDLQIFRGDYQLTGTGFRIGEIVPSSDASLSALTLNGVTLTPGFTSGNTAYTAYAANNVSTTTVAATPTDAGAIVNAADLGVKNLEVGANTITIHVTAANASTKTYTIVVTRAAAITGFDISSIPNNTLKLGDDFFDMNSNAMNDPQATIAVASLLKDGINKNIAYFKFGGKWYAPFVLTAAQFLDPDYALTDAQVNAISGFNKWYKAGSEIVDLRPGTYTITSINQLSAGFGITANNLPGAAYFNVYKKSTGTLVNSDPIAIGSTLNSLPAVYSNISDLEVWIYSDAAGTNKIVELRLEGSSSSGMLDYKLSLTPSSSL